MRRRATGRRWAVSVAPQNPVRTGFEARHVAGHELRSDRDRPVVDLELHPARES